MSPYRELDVLGGSKGDITLRFEFTIPTRTGWRTRLVRLQGQYNYSVLKTGKRIYKLLPELGFYVQIFPLDCRKTLRTVR